MTNWLLNKSASVMPFTLSLCNWQLGLDDYFKIIEVPMDLGTIKTKLDTGGYNSSEEFESDVRLTFENATTYNSEGTVVHDMARELKKYFEDDLKKHPTHQRLVFKLGTK